MKVSETLPREGKCPGKPPSERRLREWKRPGKLWPALAAVVPLALSGCKTFHHLLNDEACNKPQPYMRATSIPSLAIPQGLTSPDTSHALAVPKLDGPAPPPRTVKDPCLDGPPSFNAGQTNATPQA
ncbi:MAG: hypothetical protein ACRES6_04475 [Steroidobacteraceae bacterium]